MLRLRTLGSLGLVAPDGAEVEAVLAQPKRLGLLVYLATAHPLGFHRRDTLLRLFWPEQSEKVARNALSQSLSFLRRHLPEGIVKSRGAQEVGVDHGLVTVDALEFQTAVETGRWADALELYRGEFLRGFHITGAPELGEWMEGERDRLRGMAAGAGWALAREQVGRGALEDGERTANRALTQMVPDETTVRQFMEILAEGGDRVAALRFYEKYLETLRNGLDLEPTGGLRKLVGLLRSEGGGSSAIEGFGARVAWPGPEAFRSRADMHGAQSGPMGRRRPLWDERTRFAGRDEELERLGHLLNGALDGRGGVAFLIGEAGTGKSVLAREFSVRAMAKHAELVTAMGTCDPHTGLGDAYRPFRELLHQLCGDVEAQWMAGAMSTDQAKRLWDLFPLTVEAIVEEGPDLLDTMVRAGELADRADAFGDDGGRLGSRVREAATRRREGGPDPVQPALFEHCVGVLRRVAKARPILLLVEDLQWADTGSLELLFQLGRHLEGARVLVLGLYRPSEVEAGRGGQRHPLLKVEEELRMKGGKAAVELGEGEDRPFFDALIDSEANALGQEFRDSLFHLTRGHALFTVELLRELEDRGNLQADDEGRWVAAENLRWERMPDKIGAVIRERIGRVPERLRKWLAVAAVEGEEFTAEVVAAVVREDASQVVSGIGGELVKRHRLVQLAGVERRGENRISRYRFRHILFQQFLSEGMDSAERAYLHERVGKALEELWGEGTEPKALELARHFREAGLVRKAVEYFRVAGERARAMGAIRETGALLQEAWDLIPLIPESAARDRTEIKLLSALLPGPQAMGFFPDRSQERIQRLVALAEEIGENEFLVWAHVARGMERHYVGRHLEFKRELDSLELVARRSGNPSHQVLLHLLRAVNNFTTGRPAETVRQAERFQALHDMARDTRYLTRYFSRADVVCLGLKALALGPCGYPERAAQVAADAQALVEAEGDATIGITVRAWNVLLQWFLRDPEKARDLLQDYHEDVRTLGRCGWTAVGAFSEGWCAAQLGDPEGGASIMSSALEMMDRCGWMIWQTGYQTALAETLCHLGKTQEALALLDRVRELMARSEERGYESEFHRTRGEVLLSLPNPDPAGAEECYRRAIAVAREQEAKLYELRATTNLTRLLAAQGRQGEARQELSSCYAWFTEGFEYQDLKEARALLDELG